METRQLKLSMLACSVALVIAGCGGSGGGGGGFLPFPPPPNNGGNPPPPPPPPAGNARVPTISPEVAAAAAKITADPQMEAMLKELRTPESAKARFDQHMELVRIASPSRSELRMAAEIHKRMTSEWGFAPAEVKTRANGVIDGTDVQIVDGLPVYNACVEIKGSYSSSPGAQSYKGQYPKVLVESHIDVVNPEVLPPDSNPFQPIKLQSLSQAVITLPSELDALSDQLQFNASGRIVEDSNYAQASRWFETAAAAKTAGGVRMYVPGYNDAMANTSGVLTLARLFKKHNIKPVYDIWVCGTAGEEGKGNLAGMKQLYGFDQDKGKGTNPLNFVVNFGNEGGGTVNFTGSHRFEMKYKAPTAPGSNSPSALEAAAASIARIAEVKTPSEQRTAPRTTYTVGTVNCEAPVAGVTPSCSILVDMRSERSETLDEVRDVIRPMFQAGVTAENARAGKTDGAADAVSLELVWYGLRPAFVNDNLSNVAIQAGWQAAEVANIDKVKELPAGSGSLNDNVPANTGVPTFNWSLASTAGSGGTHAFWEWGTRGNPEREVLRLQRAMTAALISAGFHAADGSVVQPAAGPIGARTAEKQ